MTRTRPQPTFPAGPGAAGADTLPLFYRLGLGGLVFASFMTQAKFIPSLRNNIGPFEILGMLMIGWFVVSPGTQRPLRLNVAIQISCGILAVAVLSQINIPDGRQQAGFVNVAIQAFFTLFLVTLYNLMRQHRVGPQTLLRWVTLALLVVGPWIIISGLDNAQNVQEVGPFRNRAHMAAYMLTAFWMALVYSQWPGLRLRGRLIAYGGVATTLYAVAVSGRRSVYLSLLLGLSALGIVFLIASRQKRRRLVVAGFFVLGILVSMYRYGPEYLPQLQFFQDRVGMIDDRLGDALAVSNDEAADKGFFALQREGIRLAFETHPLLGIGWGGFAKSHYSPTGHEVHSTPLRFLAETGLLGFALYVLLMLSLIRSVWRGFVQMRRTPYGNAFLVLAVGLSSLLVSYAYNRHVTERTFWLLMAVIFAMELFAAQSHAAARTAPATWDALPQGAPRRSLRPALPVPSDRPETVATPPDSWADPWGAPS